MTAIRGHRFYNIELHIETKDRIEDNMGELMGYSDPHRISKILTVVAPSQRVAEAWALEHLSIFDPVIKSVSSVGLDGFVQEHIW